MSSDAGEFFLPTDDRTLPPPLLELHHCAMSFLMVLDIFVKCVTFYHPMIKYRTMVIDTVVSDTPVRITRKPIRTIRLTIQSRDASVRVSAPLHVPMERILSFVQSKFGWIQKHRTRLMEQPWSPPLRFEEGEEHLFLGKRFPLRCFHSEESPSALFVDGVLRLTLPVRSRRDLRRELVENAYRNELRRIIPPMMQRYERSMGVSVHGWGIKKMKTRWGSCNVITGRISINLELAKHPLRIIEHVVVHEMVHLLEPKHNARFRSLMDHYFPGWRSDTFVIDGAD